MFCVAGPLERHPLAGPLLERRPVGRHRLLEPFAAALPLAQAPKGGAEVVLRHGPVERHPLAGPLLECGPVGHHRLLEPFAAALPLAQAPKGGAEVVLRHGPVERHPLAGHLLECGPVGHHRLLEPFAAALPLAQALKGGAEVVLHHGPLERHPLAGPLLEQVTIARNRLLEGRVVALLLTLAIEGFGLALAIPGLQLLLARRHQCCGLAEVLGGLPIVPLGQRQVALDRGRRRRADQLRLLGRLRLRAQLPCLLRRGDLRLGRRPEQLMGLGKMPRRDLGLGLLDQVARDGIVRVERRRLRLQPLVVVGDLGQRRRQLLQRHILLADDAQQGLGRVLGDPQLLAQGDDRLRERASGARRGGSGEFLHLLRAQPIVAGDRVATGVAPGGDAAIGGGDLGIAQRPCRGGAERERHQAHGARSLPSAHGLVPLRMTVLPLASRPAAMPPVAVTFVPLEASHPIAATATRAKAMVAISQGAGGERPPTRAG